MYFKEQREQRIRKLIPKHPIYPGDPEAVARPDPIPNSAVKRCVANGSACRACARVGRCRVFYFPLFHLLFSLLITKIEICPLIP